MDHIFDHYKKTGYLHHAHVLVGRHEEVVPPLTRALAMHFDIEVEGNPDVTVAFYESFGIDEARALTEDQTRAGWGGARLLSPTCSDSGAMSSGGQARKFFIITTSSFTREAQNALLKTFEEPTEGTHFFIIIPHEDMLLPTLRSRVVVVAGGTGEAKDDTARLAEQFLAGTLAERFALAKKIGEMHDRAKTRRILDHVERILYTRLAGKPDNGVFQEIFQVKTYLSDRGSSPKMLMEHIAIVLPRSV